MSKISDAERAQFEAWARQEPRYFNIARSGNEYYYPTVQDAWTTWQAALASVQPSPAGQGDALRDVANAIWLIRREHEDRCDIELGKLDPGHPVWDEARAAVAALAARQPVGEPVEMSPEFTDTARAAIAWVLWHHQGGSSPVGQPLRFALGMGQHDRMTDYQIAEAKRFAAWANATTEDFHHRDPAQAVDLEQFRRPVETWKRKRERSLRQAIAAGKAAPLVEGLRRNVADADRLLAVIDSSKAVQS
mgnify:CR=1 FL=1